MTFGTLTATRLVHLKTGASSQGARTRTVVHNQLLTCGIS